ncbi:phosphonoacetaldehyde hydrolase [Mariniblastus fucicola]|uniref:phosphonoacetaldehyde hydrolase n=1 Tax=Mariniblastus fucicola TaxID=980251 RepID=A0A5B9PGZ3_9BACT|nr:phosphonoacetaldehyde hydrolase [Mariniblastus fucicola]QEG24032.1 Phosphonoacetaldehyde hydrolase [Mariniblastus fucicola]
MISKQHKIRGVVLDWAGTMVDHGSLAPAMTFQKTFQELGVEVSLDEAREPMGMAKRAHIEAVLKMPEVQKRWQQHSGSPSTDADVDAIYEKFLPLQAEVIAHYSTMIPGAVEAYQWCTENDVRVASTTGYTRALMESVTPIAHEAGYRPEVVLCAEDAPQGRPAPWLIYECAKQIGVYPMCCMLKVDDTIVGIEAGRNAGVWTVGISKSGNLVGLSEQQCSEFDPAELSSRVELAEQKLLAAGAHFVIQSVAELPELIAKINGLLADRQTP